MRFKKVFILTLVILISIVIASCANDDMIETFGSTIATTIFETFETIETTFPEFTMTEATKPILFDEYITFDCKYISDGDVMSYALYTPSTATNYESIPMIVWLHGSGEVGISEEWFLKLGLPPVLSNWTLEGFNAYVLCPQLVGKWNSYSWDNKNSKENLKALIDKFISEHNVDVDNIVITGHSLGGQGALYMAHQLPEYFSKAVVLSGYPPNNDFDDESDIINIAEITIPTIGYVGLKGYGEDSYTANYMHSDFANAFGEESVFDVETYHGNVPNMTFNEDKDGNNRSDVVEWMFSN